MPITAELSHSHFKLGITVMVMVTKGYGNGSHRGYNIARLRPRPSTT